MEELNKFKEELDALRLKQTQLQVRLDDAVTKAAQLKEKLFNLGYHSLNEAKEAYAALVKQVENQQEQVAQLTSQISKVESSLPTKDEILKKLREDTQKSLKEVSSEDKNSGSNEGTPEIKSAPDLPTSTEDASTNSPVSDEVADFLSNFNNL